MTERTWAIFCIPVVVFVAVAGMMFLGVAPLEGADTDQIDSTTDGPIATDEGIERPVIDIFSGERVSSYQSVLSDNSIRVDAVAVQNLPTSERNIAQDELALGESTTVTVDIELSEENDVVAVQENFDPNFENVKITNTNPEANIKIPSSLAPDETGLVRAVWTDTTDTASVEYEVTIPEDAEDGDIFTITGNGGSQGNPIETAGDNQIEVVETVPPASFDVTITDTNSPVEESDQLEVTAEIENTGGEEATQDIELDVGGLGTDSASVTLDGGESTTETFSVDTEAGDAGDYTATVASDDDSDTADVTVEEEPDEAEYTLSNLDPKDATVTAGEDPIDISAAVENVGDESGQQDLELTITDDSDSVVYSDTVEDVELDGGDSETVTFEDAPAGNLAPGEYTHEVASEDDSIVGSLTVEEVPDEAFFEVTITETNSPVVAGETLEVTADIENTGDKDATQDIELDAGALGTDATSVTLDGGESTSVTLSVDTEAGDVGDYTATVASDNDRDTADVTVEEAPDEAEYTLSNLDPADATVTAGGDPIDISADVENVGDETGEKDIELMITDSTDSVVYSDTVEDVELDGDDSETVTFEDAPAGDLAPGDYTHEVSSEDDSITGSFIVAEEPFFTVEISDVTDPVKVGEELEVIAEISNPTFSAETTQDIEFRFDDTIEETKSVTLNGGSDTTVTFTFDTSDIDPGEYDVEVASENSSVDFPVTIDSAEEANFQLSDLDPADATVTAGGDPIDISAAVENVGDETGEQDIDLIITDAGGAVAYSDTIADVGLDDGETTTVTFDDAPAGDLAPGEYTHKVSSDDNNVTGSLTVEEAPDPPSFEVTIISVNSPIVEGETLELNVGIENTGDEGSTQEIEFDVGGLGTASVSVNLAGGESTDETLTIETQVGDAGDYTGTVESDNDSDTTDITVEEQPDPAEYQLSNLTPTDATVTGGDDPIDISADVENVGDETGEQDLELRITDDNGSVSYSDTVEDVALDSGDSKTITFEDAPAGSLAPSEYTHEVSSDNESVAGSLTVEAAAEPALLAVNLIDTNSPVVEGGPLQVTVEVENTGGEEATQEVELEAAGLGTDSAPVTLAGGESSTETLSIATQVGDAGDYTATVATDDDSDSTGVTVQEPIEEANFQLSNLVPADATVTEGNDPIDISADVENVGDETGKQDIELAITNASGSVVYSDTAEDIELNGGESATVTFEDAPAGDLALGDYTHEVSSDDDSVTGSLTIEEEDQEPVYWQVDFAAGAEPPMPPSYWPDDLMAALGNSDEGVTQNPSLRRQQTDGQLGDVNIIDNEFKFDDQENPTEVTVKFEIDDDGEARDLHLAVFTLPGPFDVDEIDQQELFDATSRTYEGGDTGELTVSIPQEDND